MVCFKLSVTDSAPNEDGEVSKAWVAQITGTHPKYKLNREFVEMTKKEGRTKYFELNESALYQIKSYNSDGEPKETFGQLEADGSFSRLSYAELVEAARKAEALDDFLIKRSGINHLQPLVPEEPLF